MTLSTSRFRFGILPTLKGSLVEVFRKLSQNWWQDRVTVVLSSKSVAVFMMSTGSVWKKLFFKNGCLILSNKMNKPFIFYSIYRAFVRSAKRTRRSLYCTLQKTIVTCVPTVGRTYRACVSVFHPFQPRALQPNCDNSLVTQNNLEIMRSRSDQVSLSWLSMGIFFKRTKHFY